MPTPQSAVLGIDEGSNRPADAALYQAKRAGKNRVATSTVHDDGQPRTAGLPAPVV